MSMSKPNGHLLTCNLDSDWGAFEKDVREGMDTIRSIHGSVSHMERNIAQLAHLNRLDEIAVTLKSMNENLIKPATSLERIPFKVLWIQFIFFSMTLLVCATLFLVERVQHSDVEVKASTDGLSISHGEN